MQLIKLTCPTCGATLEVDATLQKAFCQYCGTQLLVDNEKRRVELDNAEELGYQFEMGRIKAQREAAQNTAAEGYWQYSRPDNYQPYYESRNLRSDKSRGVAFLLCFFLGIFGAHYFYVRRAGMGVLYMFTGGLFGIGWFVDMIRVAVGSFTDDNGRYV